MTETIQPSTGLSLPGLENIRAKARSAGQVLRGGEKTDNEALRRELVKVNNQFQQTQKIIQGDREALSELAKSDERVAKLLALSDDTKTQIISNKILDRAHVTQQEAALLISNLKDTTGVLGDLNRTFEVDVGDVVRNFGSLVSDSRIDTESRRKMAQDIAEFAQESLTKEQTRLEAMDEIPLKQLEQLEMQQAALNDLTKVVQDSPSSAEFEKNSDAISKLVTRLGDKTTEIKTLTTLNNLNNTMDSAVLTQEELTETLEKQVSPGKSFEDFFKENPDAFTQEGIGGGIVSQALGALGLGGLEDLLAPRVGGLLGRGVGAVGRLGARGVGGLARGGGIGGGIGGVARAGVGAVGGIARGGAAALGAGGLALGGRAAGGAGGLLKGLGGLAGKAAGFAKFLGPLGATIAIGKGIFDAVDGFNRAADIAGLKEGEEATFGQKIQAAASSSLSGLTFGLLDEKTIFQGIESVKGSLSDGVSFLGEKATAIWDSVSSSFTSDNIKSVASSTLSGLTFGLLSPETISSGIDKVSSTLSDGVSAVGDFAKKAWEDPMGTLTGALSSVGEFITSGGFLGAGVRAIDGVFGTDIGGWFSEKLGTTGEAVSGVFTKIGGFLTDSMTDVAKFFDPEAIFQSVTDWGTSLGTSIKDKVKGWLSFLPGFGEEEKAAIGTVPTDGATRARLVEAGMAPATPARVTPLPTNLPEVGPDTLGPGEGSAAAIRELRDELRAMNKRAPVPVNIPAVAEKPPLDRRTDIGDGMLGMLSTILDG